MSKNKIFVDKNDAIKILLELTEIPDVEVQFSIDENIKYSEKKEHPLYSLDYTQLSELVIAGLNTLASISALVTALITYRNTLKESKKSKGEKVFYPVIVINDEPIEIGDNITAEDLKKKLIDRKEDKDSENTNDNH